ncbi:MAG: PorP/SprF family type IX secretion system membrane protein [Bacteroidetes bacterium]|nr:PorP/SprF family type IX secretion system membrane protein [Bacteroidota bacterium]
MKQFVLGVFILLACLNTRAQDIHFSQFYASPLTLNPAMTGFFNGGYRFAANYRSQWASINAPDWLGYITQSASFDVPLLKGSPKLGNDFIGVGIMVMTDQQGLLSDSRVMLSGAYHKNLGLNQLTLGLQAGFNQKLLNWTAGTTLPSDWQAFSNQPGGRFVSEGSPPSELNLTLFYPDFGVGLLWAASLTKTLDAFSGFSYFHVIPPKENLMQGVDYKLPSRAVLNGGLRYELRPQTTYLTPHFIFMSQGGAQEINVGASVEYRVTSMLNGDGGIVFGPYLRWSLAPKETLGKASTQDLIFATGLLYKNNMRFGFSYDININALGNEVTRNKGGFELSIIYIGNVTTSTRAVILPCPLF